VRAEVWHDGDCGHGLKPATVRAEVWAPAPAAEPTLAAPLCARGGLRAARVRADGLWSGTPVRAEV